VSGSPFGTVPAQANRGLLHSAQNDAPERRHGADESGPRSLHSVSTETCLTDGFDHLLVVRSPIPDPAANPSVRRRWWFLGQGEDLKCSVQGFSACVGAGGEVRFALIPYWSGSAPLSVSKKRAVTQGSACGNVRRG